MRSRSKAKSLALYRSKLEEKVAAMLPVVEYETTKLKYIVPASSHSYTPDFKLKENIYLEVKGYLDASTRKKMILVKEQNPDVEIKFFFDKASNKLYKGSPTSYADWADKNGFPWTDIKRGFPPEWLE